MTSESNAITQEKLVTSMWYTSKLLEKSVREASSWIQETVSSKRVESDAEVQRLLTGFDKLKKDQSQMVNLLQEYTQQQQALQQTEANISLLLTEMGQHENSSSIRDCLTIAGNFFGRINKVRDELVKKSETVAAALQNFSATAIEDLKLSVRKYDSARREYLASEKTASRSKSITTNAERREMMQAEMDEATNNYRLLSWQVSQKVKILTHHRTREVCTKITDLMDAETVFIAAASETARTCGFRPYVPNEREANEVINACFAQEPPAPVVSPSPGFARPAFSPKHPFPHLRARHRFSSRWLPRNADPIEEHPSVLAM